MRTPHLILSSALLISGCASYTWHHATNDKQQFYADKLECAGVSQRLTRRTWGDDFDRTVEECLFSRGYSKTRK